MIRVTLTVLLVMAAGMAFGESQEEALRAAQAQVERDMAALRAAGAVQQYPDENTLRGMVDPKEAAQMRAILRNPGGDAEGMAADIKKLNKDILGTDVIQDAVTKIMAPGGGQDPNGTMTFQTGPQGLLWVFWAMDAPGIEDLPAQIAEVHKTWPEMVIRDSHVMCLSNWQEFLKKLSHLKDALQAETPGEAIEVSIARKKAMRDQAMPPLDAATIMARSRRLGGYLIIENQDPGLAYHVGKIPCLVFMSPAGLVHRVNGLNQKRPIGMWIAQTQEWERDNHAVIKERTGNP